MRGTSRPAWQCQKGFSSIIAVIVMMLLGVIGAGLTSVIIAESKMSSSYNNKIAAQYLAEAGVRRAVLELLNDPAWTGTQGSVLLGNGTYLVSIAGNGDNRTITSQGVIGTKGTMNYAHQQAVVNVTLGSSNLSQAFTYAAFVGFDGKASVTLSNSSSSIYGNLGSYLSQIYYVWYYTASVPSVYDGQFIPNQTVTQPAVPSTSVSLTPDDYKTQNGVATPTLPQDCYNGTGDYSNMSGLYYVDRAFQLNGPSFITRSTATIFVNGSAEFNSNLGDNFTIITTGNISVNSDIGSNITIITTGNVAFNNTNLGDNVTVYADSVNFNSGGKKGTWGGNMKVYVQGDANIYRTLGDDALVMANGNMHITQTGPENAVLYSGGTLTYDGANVTGSVAAGSMVMNGGTITYSKSVVDQVLGTSSGFTINSWNNQ
ncbi:Hypothetical protein LUCI_2110 [Lucifera butyrica]|uniref:Type 4 fimbrial biogenesis protein PilX N-terminal domain-containing protein n=1 Tax=Lucifera butyrica TaxID=1351585 RepID=A0A498R9R0_9FIRM|nr:hypothetical protein [Lucifera butyrica]VBB06873.1 Hypothetical protein LUCI_2110 [Lucifera butyrica]